MVLWYHRAMVAFAVAATSITVAFASEQTIPMYDVETTCHSIADKYKSPQTPASAIATVFNGCVSKEQESYDDLKSLWPDVPDEVVNLCEHQPQSKQFFFVGFGACISAQYQLYASRHAQPNAHFQP